MKASIIIPWIRKHKFERCVSIIEQTAGISKKNYEIVAEEDKDRIGCPLMVKRLVEQAKSDNICFLGDDALPKWGFLENALIEMAKFPDGYGLVGFYDAAGITMTGQDLATHWLASKKLLPDLGGEFFHTGYAHCFCDVELTERCREMGRYIYSKTAIVLHDHELLDGKTLTDPDLKRVYSPEIFGADQELLKQRRANNWGKG